MCIGSVLGREMLLPPGQQREQYTHRSEVKAGNISVPSTQYNEEAEDGVRSLRAYRCATLGKG